MENERDGDTNCNCCSWYSHQRISTRTEVLGNNGTAGDHPNCRKVLEIRGNLLSLNLHYREKLENDNNNNRRSPEKINHLMYMDDIKLFAKNEKELETLIHAVRIYSPDIGMEFCIEKCAMLLMKSGKRYLTDGLEQKIKTSLECSQKTKPTNTWVSWRQTLSNKWKWKTRF